MCCVFYNFVKIQRQANRSVEQRTVIQTVFKQGSGELYWELTHKVEAIRLHLTALTIVSQCQRIEMQLLRLNLETLCGYLSRKAAAQTKLSRQDDI